MVKSVGGKTYLILNGCITLLKAEWKLNYVLTKRKIMQLVPGINRGRKKGSSVGYKQICAMEASLVSNWKTMLCREVTVGIVPARSEWLAAVVTLGKADFFYRISASVSWAEEINQCTLPKVYNHGFCKWKCSLWVPLCTRGRSFVLLVNHIQLKDLDFGMQKPDSQVLEDELPLQQCRFT